MPQFNAIAKSRFLTSMAVALHKEKAKPGASPQDQSLLSAMVTNLLTRAIAKTHIFEPKTKNGPMTPDAALRLIELCLWTRNVDLVRAITDRLTDATNVSPEMIKTRVRDLLMPLLPLVDAKMKACALDVTAVPGLQQFYETTFEHALSFMLSGSGTMSQKSDLALLVDASTVYGGVEVLSKR